MTQSPDVMSAKATVEQALLQLQYGGYRTVPVTTDDGAPLGALDVLQLIEGALSVAEAAPAAAAAEETTLKGGSKLQTLVGMLLGGLVLGAFVSSREDALMQTLMQTVKTAKKAVETTLHKLGDIVRAKLTAS